MCLDVLPACPDCKQCGRKYSPYLKGIPSRKKCEHASKKPSDPSRCQKFTARTVYGKKPCFACVKKMEEQRRRALIQREGARIELEENKAVEDAKAKEIARGRKDEEKAKRKEDIEQRKVKKDILAKKNANWGGA